jgi:hypothetical protein
MAFDVLQERLGQGGGKEYLRILELAARESESRVDEGLRVLLEEGPEAVNAEAVKAALRKTSLPLLHAVQVATVDLRQFDELCSAPEVWA